MSCGVHGSEGASPELTTLDAPEHLAFKRLDGHSITCATMRTVSPHNTVAPAQHTTGGRQGARIPHKGICPRACCAASEQIGMVRCTQQHDIMHHRAMPEATHPQTHQPPGMIAAAQGCRIGRPTTALLVPGHAGTVVSCMHSKLPHLWRAAQLKPATHRGINTPPSKERRDLTVLVAEAGAK